MNTLRLETCLRNGKGIWRVIGKVHLLSFCFGVASHGNTIRVGSQGLKAIFFSPVEEMWTGMHKTHKNGR